MQPPHTDEIYIRHLLPVLQSDAFYGFCFSLTRDPTDAEDLVAEISARAWSFRDRYRHEGKAKGWLYTMAKRRWISGRETSRARADANARLAMDGTCSLVRGSIAHDDVFGEIDGAEAYVDRLRQWEAAAEEIDALPDHYREVIVDTYEDRPWLETAERLGIAPGTVLGRRFRAVARLRDALC